MRVEMYVEGAPIIFAQFTANKKYGDWAPGRLITPASLRAAGGSVAIFSVQGGDRVVAPLLVMTFYAKRRNVLRPLS